MSQVLRAQSSAPDTITSACAGNIQKLRRSDWCDSCHVAPLWEEASIVPVMAKKHSTMPPTRGPSMSRQAPMRSQSPAKGQALADCPDVAAMLHTVMAILLTCKRLNCPLAVLTTIVPALGLKSMHVATEPSSTTRVSGWPQQPSVRGGAIIVTLPLARARPSSALPAEAVFHFKSKTPAQTEDAEAHSQKKFVNLPIVTARRNL